MNTDKLKPQSTATRCSIAVIRAILYYCEKKDEQTNEDIEKETRNDHKYAMIIITTPKPNIFHCVLFDGIEGDKIRYWDPNPYIGNQLVSKNKFDRMRKHDDGKRRFREIHYISPIAG